MTSFTFIHVVTYDGTMFFVTAEQYCIAFICQFIPLLATIAWLLPLCYYENNNEHQNKDHLEILMLYPEIKNAELYI